jgi:beta-galactosidase/beta-glucuronidase
MHPSDPVTRREFIRAGAAATIAGVSVTGAKRPDSPHVAGKAPRLPAVNSVDHPDKVSSGLTRPQRVSLDGDWKFQLDPKDAGENEKWFEPGRVTERIAKVPLPWELVSEELRDYAGVAWYGREIAVPFEFRDKRVALGFHGVSHHAKVWVNGRPAGEHTGAQASFILDITGAVSPGRTSAVTVRVFNPRKGAQFFMDISSLLRVSGLWQSVWMEATGRAFISDLFMIPDIGRSRATARTSIYVPPLWDEGTLRLLVGATNPDSSKFESSQEVEVEKSSEGRFLSTELNLELPNPVLWDIDHPNLYSVEAQLSGTDGKAVDVALTEFGMRKFEARDGRFWLNDKIIYLVSAGPNPTPFGGSGDVTWSLPGPYAFPTEEEIKSDIEKIKSLNFNLVRSALRPMHPAWLRLADRMGLLVMQEGSWTRFNDLQGYKDNWAEMLLRDRNHPSAVIWTLFNESWGIEYAGALYDHVKSLDPTRLIVDNSGGHVLQGPNYPGNHGNTDFEDVHNYPSFNRFDTSRDYWLNLRMVKRPLLVTEFGPIPYIFDVEKMKKAWNGKDVWWLKARELTLDWNHNQMPEEWDHIGFEDRFHQWGMDEIYGDFGRFTQAHDWYFYWGLKCQTQWMRMNPEINGFNIWLWDDSNHPLGMIDYYGNKKVFADQLGKIFTPDLVILDKQQHNFWGGHDYLCANLHVSHFSQEDMSGARVEWRLEQSDLRGEIPCIPMASGDVRLVGDLRFKIPEVSGAEIRRLSVRLVSGQGKTLSENYEPIWIFPAADRKVSAVPFAMARSGNMNPELMR